MRRRHEIVLRGRVFAIARDDGQRSRRQGAAPLVREDDRAVYGDKGCASAKKRRAAEEAGVKWAVKEKAPPGRKLTARQRARNRRFGSVRAKVEHVFRINEMPVRLPQGALSLHRQERRTGVRAAGACKSLPRSQAACVRVTLAGAKKDSADSILWNEGHNAA
jgi:IS5 family transposase